MRGEAAARPHTMISARDGFTIRLRGDEVDFLQEHWGRCVDCDHLKALHNVGETVTCDVCERECS